MKKKIVHIITGLGNGGAEMMLFKLLSNTDLSIYDVKVISMIDKGLMGKDIEALGIEVNELNANSLTDKVKGLVKSRRICKDADIIQTWMYHADLFGFIVGKIMLKKKLIWGIRHGELIRGVDKKSTIMLVKVNSLLSKFVDDIISCSKVSKEFHIRFGYDEKLKVIPNGFELDKFKKVNIDKISFKRNIGINETDKVLISVGRWNKAKDYPNLLKAISILKKYRSDFICILVGNGLLDNIELNMLINELDISSNIKILGRRTDVPQLLSLSDVFISHSAIEGFSNVLGEAMACEVPCVVTDVGDSSFILGELGIVVEANNSIMLAEGIRKYLDIDEGKKLIIGKKIRNRIVDNFDINIIVKKFEKIYNN